MSQSKYGTQHNRPYWWKIVDNMALATKLVVFYLGMVALLPIALPTMVPAVFCCSSYIYCGDDAPGLLEFVRRNYIRCGIWPFLLVGAVLGLAQCLGLALVCCPCVCCCIQHWPAEKEERGEVMTMLMIIFVWLSVWPCTIVGKYQPRAIDDAV